MLLHVRSEEILNRVLYRFSWFPGNAVFHFRQPTASPLHIPGPERKPHPSAIDRADGPERTSTGARFCLCLFLFFWGGGHFLECRL